MATKTTKILHKRGLEGNMPQLEESEIAYTTDSNKLFVGSSRGNVMLAISSELSNASEEASQAKVIALEAKLKSEQLKQKLAEAMEAIGIKDTEIKDINTLIAELSSQKVIGEEGISAVNMARKEGLFYTPADLKSVSSLNARETTFFSVDNRCFTYLNFNTSSITLSEYTDDYAQKIKSTNVADTSSSYFFGGTVLRYKDGYYYVIQTRDGDYYIAKYDSNWKYHSRNSTRAPHYKIIVNDLYDTDDGFYYIAQDFENDTVVVSVYYCDYATMNAQLVQNLTTGNYRYMCTVDGIIFTRNSFYSTKYKTYTAQGSLIKEFDNGDGNFGTEQTAHVKDNNTYVVYRNNGYEIFEGDQYKRISKVSVLNATKSISYTYTFVGKDKKIMLITSSDNGNAALFLRDDRMPIGYDGSTIAVDSLTDRSSSFFKNAISIPRQTNSGSKLLTVKGLDVIMKQIRIYDSSSTNSYFTYETLAQKIGIE